MWSPLSSFFFESSGVVEVVLGPPVPPPPVVVLLSVVRVCDTASVLITSLDACCTGLTGSDAVGGDNTWHKAEFGAMVQMSGEGGGVGTGVGVGVGTGVGTGVGIGVGVGVGVGVPFEPESTTRNRTVTDAAALPAPLCFE